MLGYEFGSDWTKVSKNFSHASDALAVLVVLMLVGLIVHKAREIRKERRADEAASVSAAAAGLGGEARPGLASEDTQGTSAAVTPGKPHSHRRNSGS